MAGQNYNDLPAGARLVAPTAYGDLPAGATVVSDGGSRPRGPVLSDEQWFIQTYGRAPVSADEAGTNDPEAFRRRFGFDPVMAPGNDGAAGLGDDPISVRAAVDPDGHAAYAASLQDQMPDQPTTEGWDEQGFDTNNTPLDWLRAAGQGLFSLGDEAEGVIGGIGGVLRGEGWQPGYDRSVTNARGEIAEYQNTNPAAATAWGVAGSIPTAFVPGLGLASRAAGPVGRMALGALAGAGGAGVSAFGAAEGSPSERLAQVGAPAAIGAGIGAALPLISPLIGRGVNWLRSPVGTTLPTERVAESVIRRNMGDATVAEVNAATDLMRAGQSHGIALTWPEALAQATNGRVNLTNLQRVAEQTRGGGAVMSRFMGDRNDQVRTAMDTAADQIGQAVDPVVLGGTVQRTAREEIEGLTDSINAVTKGLYQSAAGTVVDPAAFAALSADPLFASALRELRGSDTLGRMVAGYPDDSVQVLDAVAQYLDRSLAARSTAAGDRLSAGIQGGVANDARRAATDASPDYGLARQQQAILRRDNLEPLQNGPVGRMAETNQLGNQIDILFETAPFEGMENSIGDAVGRLVSADPTAAAGVVRQHLVQTFDEAAQALRGGANQFGGAGFAARLVGNNQQARNLEAAVRALPGGDVKWEGFNRLLDVLKATGQRQASGSGTSFNNEIIGELRGGRGLANAASLIASPGKGTSAIREWFSDLQLGRNSTALARILTDPSQDQLFRRLAIGGSLSDLTPIVLRLLQAANANAVPDAVNGSPFASQPPLLAPAP